MCAQLLRILGGSKARVYAWSGPVGIVGTIFSDNSVFLYSGFSQLQVFQVYSVISVGKMPSIADYCS